jgi:hypothetical protein
VGVRAAARGGPGRAGRAVGGAVEFGGAISPHVDGSHRGPEGAEEGDGWGRLVLREVLGVGLPVTIAVRVGEEGLGTVEDAGAPVVHRNHMHSGRPEHRQRRVRIGRVQLTLYEIG